MKPQEFEYAIVDADSILYKLAYGVQSTMYKTDEGLIFPSMEDLKFYMDRYPTKEIKYEAITENEEEDLNSVVNSFEAYIDWIKERVNAKYTIAIVGNEEDTFRDKLATIVPYKGNRTNVKPLILDALKEELVKKELVVVAPVDLEADDEVIKNFVEAQGENKDKAVLCGIDKDALQVEGWHYNYNNDVLFYVSDHQALYNFYSQLLTGDPVDNVKGLYGIGSTSKILKDLKSLDTEQKMFDRCKVEYLKRFHNYTYKFMKENFMLLYMTRTNEVENERRFELLYEGVH